MQPHWFPDELAYNDDDNEKGDKLHMERLRKSRYVVWDIESFALDQTSGKGRQVPHLIVAATVCYACLNKPFQNQMCGICEGQHNSDFCLSKDQWLTNNAHTRVSTWGSSCNECKQQLFMCRAGSAKELFKQFINWLLSEQLRGFTMVAHNAAGFDNHYLLRPLSEECGLTVEPIYSGSRLLQILVKKSKHDKDFVLRAIDSAQFFLAALKNLPKQFGLDTTDMKKGFFPISVRQAY